MKNQLKIINLYRNDAFVDWKKKKESAKRDQLDRKRMVEEKKTMEKQEKDKVKSETMDRWFLRQAAIMEHEYRKNKAKKQKEKDEKDKKQNEENIKKEQAQEAYRLWVKQKEEEKSKYRNEKDPNKEKQKKKYTHTPAGKITIGPYTKSKELRELHKRLIDENVYVNEDGDEKKNKNVDDSLEELSSIKKDTPRSVNDNEYD